MSFSLLASAGFVLGLRIRPEPVPGEMDKNIFERWLAERNRFDSIGFRDCHGAKAVLEFKWIRQPNQNQRHGQKRNF